MLLREFQNDNMHRAYPLDDSATGMSEQGVALPTSFMVGLTLVAPQNSDAGYLDSFYISKVTIMGISVAVEVSCDSPGMKRAIGSFKGISTTLEFGDSTISRTFELVSERDVFASGTLGVGTCADLPVQGIYTFTKDSGKICPLCIAMAPTGLASLSIDGTSLTGDVEIIAGSGVEFAVDSQNRVTVFAKYDGDFTDVIRTPQDLLNAVIGLYGRPLTSINGKFPDSTGNMELVGANCTSITPGSAENVLVMENLCNRPCSDKSELDLVYSNLNDINTNYGRLQQLYNSLVQNLMMMLARLSEISELIPENTEGGCNCPSITPPPASSTPPPPASSTPPASSMTPDSSPIPGSSTVPASSVVPPPSMSRNLEVFLSNITTDYCALTNCVPENLFDAYEGLIYGYTYPVEPTLAYSGSIELTSKDSSAQKIVMELQAKTDIPGPGCNRKLGLQNCRVVSVTIRGKKLITPNDPDLGHSNSKTFYIQGTGDSLIKQHSSLYFNGYPTRDTGKYPLDETC